MNQNVSPNKIRLRNKVNTGNDRNTTIEEGKVDHFHEEQQSQQVVHQIEHPGLVKKVRDLTECSNCTAKE